MTPLDHADNRGVFVELWTLDLLGGDLFAALLLSQLLWWHQPGKDGRPKVTHHRDGNVWLLRPDDGWQDDCRMTVKQVRRVRSVLLAAGLIEHRRFKLNGAPTSAWRPLYDRIQGAIRPEPELPSEGQFQGSGSGGAVPSDPQGEVPIPSPPLEPLPLTPTPVEQVFQAWLTSTKKTARTVLDSKRRSLIERALRTHPMEDVLDAVRGWEHSPHHRGENPERKVWNDLGLLLRDAGKIEQFRDLARGPRLEGRPGGPARGNLPYRPPLIDTDRSGPSRVLTEDDL